MASRFLLLALAVAAVSAQVPLPPSLLGGVDLTVAAATNRLLDAHGRERVFHGTNIVVKAPPYRPDTSGAFDAAHSLNDADDLALLQSMGYTTIRLSVPWAAVEPARGEYDHAYLAEMVAIVNRAGARGIYTVVDFHQDAWNAKFCGNGVPDWAAQPNADDFPVPLLATPVPKDNVTGHPTRATCDGINNNNWSFFYLTYATATAIGNMYDNVNALRDSFVGYWKTVASAFAGNPFVIGYELMNEPFAGNIYANPLLLVPGYADRFKLQPLYDAVNAAIRAVDTTHLILFQAVVWEVVVEVGEQYGFASAPGGAAWANKSVLTWHNSVLSQYTPDATYYAWKFAEMQRLGTGGWVTETVGTGVLPLLDSYQLSWMHWDYKSFANLTYDMRGLFKGGVRDDLTCVGDMAQCLDVTQVPQWSGTYAKAIAGRMQSFTFDAATRVAVLVYTIDPAITQPTVIFASAKWVYNTGAGGFAISATPPGAVAFSLEYADHVVVTHVAPVAAINVTITILPR